MQFTVRKAVKRDVPEILRLIKELAEYEKAPQEVKVTLEELENDGFGPNAVYSAFVAEAAGKIVGMALYYVKYSTWKGKCIYLDDIVVNQEYRRHGIGAKLFEEVVKVCKAMGARKMDWQVLDWNEPAIEFYKKYDTVFSNEWVNCTLHEKQLKDLKL
jgi:GNAT superfamily N-acetyltransferase